MDDAGPPDSHLIVLPVGRDMMIARDAAASRGHAIQYLPRPADWPYWIQMEEVDLWEAVLLSLNVDPRIEPPSEIIDRFRAITWALEGLGIPNRHRFEERYKIAVNSCETGALRAREIGRRSRTYRVRLDAFSAWAQARPRSWEVPNELRAHVTPFIRQHVDPVIVDAPPAAPPTDKKVGLSIAPIEPGFPTPDKITVKYLYEHMPASWVPKALAALLFTFVAGVTVGQIPWVAKLFSR